MWKGFINLDGCMLIWIFGKILLTQVFDSQIVTCKLSFVIG